MRGRLLPSLVVLAALVAGTATPDSPEQAQIDFANGLFQRGFFEDAMAEYEGYLAKHPQGEHVNTALYRLGEAAYAAKQYDKALEAFDRVLAVEMDAQTQQRATLSRAEVLYFLERPADATLALEALTDKGVAPEVRARALYYQGKIMAESNDAEAAGTAFKTLIKELPENAYVPFAQYQLAFVYLGQGKLEDAALEFSAVAASDAAGPLRAEARFRAAETYDRNGWFTAAVQAYQQLQRDFPESEYAQRAHYGYTWALYHAGNYAEAAAAAATFIAERPEAPETIGTRYLIGNCLQQQKKYDEAIATYEQIRADHADSEFAARARYKLAWCLYLNGKLKEAKQAVSAFLQSPSDLGLVGDAAFLLGSIMVSQGDYESAYEEFRLVAEKYPDGEFGAEALYKAGECLAQLGRTDEAAKLFESFAQKYPDNLLAEQAILRAGDAELLSSAFDLAVEKYKKILESPTDPTVERNALYRLAITYHNMKDYDASAETFRTLIEKHPAGPRVAEAHVRIGDNYMRGDKDVLKALDAYNAALEAGPENEHAGRALKGVALARYELKDYDAAAETFLRLMTEYPSVSLNEATYAWTGQRFFDQEKWDQASAAFRSLLVGNPDYANPERVHLKIAECAEAAGKADEAINLYQVVVETAPRTSVAMEAKFRMAKLHEAREAPDEAFKLYEEVANASTGAAAAKARFRLGELHEGKGEFDAAARNYMYVVVVFLHEELAPEALWRAAQCYDKAEEPGKAGKTYEELVRDYPDSPQAGKAKDQLAQVP